MEIGRTYDQPVTGQAAKRSEQAANVPQTRAILPWRITKTIAEVLYFGMVALIVFLLAYVLGRVILIGPVGNDSLLHIANVEWFDRFLPDVPNWFPLQGGGISLQRSYSVYPYFLVSVTRRLAGISVLQAYRLISFISIPMAALSVYVFCRMVLNSRSIGWIAAVLFVLSPISWSWIYVQGYLATTVAIVSLPLVLLCFDRYMSCLVSDQTGIKRRAWLAALVVIFAITVLSHVVVAAAAISGMAFYAFFLATVSKKGERLRTFVIGVKSLLACGLVAGLILAFWAVPLLSYTKATNPNGESRLAESSISRPSLSELFSTKPLGATEWGWYPDSSIPTVVGVLFIVGMIAAVPFSRKTLALGLSGIAAIAYTLVPELAISLTKLFSMWSAVISVRSFTVLASVLFPVVAAYGIWAIPRAPVKATRLLVGKETWQRLSGKPIVSALGGMLAAVLSIAIAGFAVYIFRNASLDSDTRVNYGVSRLGTSVQDIWGIGDASKTLIEQLSPDNWPALEIADTDAKVDEVDRVASLLPDRQHLRMDVSPYLGMYAQSLAVQSGASQINTYIWPANLMWSTWGYQQKVLFIDSPPEEESGTPIALNDAADWFGTEFVYINPVEDRIDIYQDAGWTLIHQENILEIWQYPEAPGLATLSTRPKVLVIGDNRQGAYDMVFRAANRGAIPLQNAFLIKGETDIDSYSLSELQDFEVLFLEGYSYRNSDRAWSLLDQYVKQGGAIFVDTGWQWGVPEWEFDVAPSVLPVEVLKWMELSATSNYRLESQNLSRGLDAADFAPLEWNGGPWGVSTAAPDQVRSWGDVVLSANGQPLIVAGSYGEGRVVWSGMNLVAHSSEHNNDAEIELLQGLVNWLIADVPSNDFTTSISRSHPDRVDIGFSLPSGQETALLWREAYYPAWHAYLSTDTEEKRELPILVGGPGFMLIPIGNTQGAGVVEIIWKTPLVERVAVGFSVLTLLALGLFLADGVFANGRLFDRIALLINARRNKELPKGSIAWLPDLDSVDFESEL